MKDINEQIETALAEVEKASREYTASGIRLKKLRQKQEAERANEESDINIFHSDNYAGMKCGAYEFYFGYEETFCIYHPDEVECDCDDEQWAFVARDATGKELMRLPQSRLASKHGDMVGYLLRGIGQFIDTLPKPEKPPRRRMWDDTGTTGGSAGDLL